MADHERSAWLSRELRRCKHSRVQFGLHALGIGSGARRDVIDAVAAAAESADFATLWAGEHVVMVDQSESRYPYTGIPRTSRL